MRFPALAPPDYSAPALRVKWLEPRRAPHYSTADEAGAGAGEEGPELGVVGMPAAGDALLGLGEAELALHDRAPLAHHPRDHSEAGDDAGVEEAAAGAADQRRVEVVGGAVEVDAGARHARGEERRPSRRGGGEELVDESVLGGADLERAEARSSGKRAF